MFEGLKVLDISCKFSCAIRLCADGDDCNCAPWDGTRSLQRGQRTTLYIMALTSRDATSSAFPLRYPNHVAMISDAIKDQLGGKKPSFVPPYKYVTLDPDNVPADEKKMYETMRGTALFQYNPDSDGKGKRAWRLWFEDQFTSVNLD